MIPEPILLNDFKRQWADTAGEVLASVERVGLTGWYILGDSVNRFEIDLATAIETDYAVGCGNGLDAIEIALRALRMPRGARVLTTPLSAFATTLAISRAGGVPVFIDVDAHGNMDLAACERVLARGRGPRHMVPVHLYGHPLDLERLASIQERFEVRVVEDCAQAIGATWSRQKVGTVGELAALSFYPTKNLGALGDAGAVMTSSLAHRDACLALRNYGQSSRYVHDRLGLNSRLDEVHAAILAEVFLPRLATWTERRRHIAARYAMCLAHSDVRCLPVDSNASPAWHLFAVRVPAVDRGHFQEHLRTAGVQSAIHYPRLIPDQEAMAEAPFEVEGDLAGAREFVATEVSLPMHPYMTDDEVSRVVNAVNDWRRP